MADWIYPGMKGRLPRQGCDARRDDGDIRLMRRTLRFLEKAGRPATATEVRQHVNAPIAEVSACLADLVSTGFLEEEVITEPRSMYVKHITMTRSYFKRSDGR